MFKGTVTNTAVTSGSNIPFTTVWNTNANTAYDNTNNAITFNNTGYYDVSAMITVTGSASTPISAQLYADGVAIPNAYAVTDITATTGIQTLNIIDTIKVNPAYNQNFANLSVRLDGNATVSGIITVEKRK